MACGVQHSDQRQALLLIPMQACSELWNGAARLAGLCWPRRWVGLHSQPQTPNPKQAMQLHRARQQPGSSPVILLTPNRGGCCKPTLEAISWHGHRAPQVQLLPQA